MTRRPTCSGARRHATNAARARHGLSAFINIDLRGRRLAELGAPPSILAEIASQLDGWSRRLVDVWRAWLAELPADTDTAWALRALACREVPAK